MRVRHAVYDALEQLAGMPQMGPYASGLDGSPVEVLERLFVPDRLRSGDLTARGRRYLPRRAGRRTGAQEDLTTTAAAHRECFDGAPTDLRPPDQF
jgi:hypothetical protein